MKSEKLSLINLGQIRFKSRKTNIHKPIGKFHTIPNELSFRSISVSSKFI